MNVLARCAMVPAMVLALLPCAALAQPKQCSKMIISADSDYAPLHWYDGQKLTGASIDIATTALSNLGIPFEVRYSGPFQRVLQGARNGEIDMISSLKDTPQRREYLAFAATPLFSNPIAVFIPKERQFSYSNWHDLIGKKGGITLGNQFGGGFDEFLASNLKIEVAQKSYMNFKKAEMGQLDYVITGYYSGMIYLAQADLANNFVALKPFVSETDNLIAISKLSPCIKHLPRLNEELESMRKKGTLAAILNRHIAQIPELSKKGLKHYGESPD